MGDYLFPRDLPYVGCSGLSWRERLSRTGCASGPGGVLAPVDGFGFGVGKVGFGALDCVIG